MWNCVMKMLIFDKHHLNTLDPNGELKANESGQASIMYKDS